MLDLIVVGGAQPIGQLEESVKSGVGCAELRTPRGLSAGEFEESVKSGLGCAELRTPRGEGLGFELVEGGGVGAQDPGEGGVLADLAEGLDHRRDVGRRLDVDVEDVLPAAAGPGAGLQLVEVEVPLGERSDAAIERAGDVADPEHQRRLVRSIAERRRRSRQGPEARVVVGIGLDPLGQDLQSVELGGSARGDRPVFSSFSSDTRFAAPAVSYSARIFTSSADRNSSDWAIAWGCETTSSSSSM